MKNLPTEMTESSMPKSSALPDPWIERLFQRMEDRYGSLWAERYGTFPRERVKRTWAEDLADMSPEEMIQGVEACKARRFPPTLPEFRDMCRPPIDYETAFHEAVQQMQKRKTGEDEWPSAALYWAAVKFGGDILAQPYSVCKTRWKSALDQATDLVKTKKLPDGVPKRRGALPAPGECTASKEKVHQMLDDMKRVLASKVVGNAIKNPEFEDDDLPI